LSAAVGNGLIASFFVLGAVIAKERLGGASAWGLILAAFAAGGVVGGLVVLRLAPRRPLRLATAALLPLASPVVALALGAPTAVIAVAGFVSSVGLMIFNSLYETTVQRVVPPAALSRVNAYDWFGSLVMQPIGFALVGVEVGALGQATTLWVAAAGIFASCAVMFAVRENRQLTLDGSGGAALARDAGESVG
jgi:hypothetical protein